MISQLWRLQSQPLHCWWNLSGPTRSCTMEKTWNSDQSLVIQRWARLLPLALVECSWERWQSLVVFCWLMFEMDSWKITNLIRSDRAPTAITSIMIGLLLNTKTFGLGNWKIQLSTALQNHISILGVQLFGFSTSVWWSTGQTDSIIMDQTHTSDVCVWFPASAFQTRIHCWFNFSLLKSSQWGKHLKIEHCMIRWQMILIFQYLSFLLVVTKAEWLLEWIDFKIFDSLTQQCTVCDDCPIVWHDFDWFTCQCQWTANWWCVAPLVD